MKLISSIQFILKFSFGNASMMLQKFFVNDKILSFSHFNHHHLQIFIEKCPPWVYLWRPEHLLEQEA